MNDHGSPRGWPFLVARGRRVGYRSILVPDFLVGTGDADVLNVSVRGDAGPDGPARIERIPTTTAGPITVVHVTHQVTQADIVRDGSEAHPADGHDLRQPDDPRREDDPGALVTDRHSRPLELLYGFVCRAGTVDELDEADLHTARRTVLDVYTQFLDDEDGFAVEGSTAFPLRSRVRSVHPRHEPPAGTPPPVTPSPPAPPSSRGLPPEPAGSSPGARTWNVIIGVLAVALLAVVGRTLLAPSSSSSPSSSTPSSAPSGITISGEPRCTLGEAGPNRCVIRLTIAVPDTFDLQSLSTDVEPSLDATASRDVWDVDDSDCREPTESSNCQLRITVNPSTRRITEDLEAELHVTFEDPVGAREVSLRARIPA